MLDLAAINQALIATIFALKSRFGWAEALAPLREREYPPGKKERAYQAALSAGEGTSWGDLLKPPPPPASYRQGRMPDKRRSSAAADEESWEELLGHRGRN